MRSADDRLISLGIGPIAAVALGALLVPLRDVTTASNLAFAFIALVIVVGHAGGRWPAVATALASALSLNFFLTQPYLTLSIHGRDDLIAFLGLTGCGLIAATLGSGRVERVARKQQLDVLHSALGKLEFGGPAASGLQDVVDSARTVFPLAALAVRDATGDIVASAGDHAKLADVPRLTAASDGLDRGNAAASARPRRAAPLPAEGVRLPLVIGKRALGSLDLWGDGRPASAEVRRTLWALARIVAAVVATKEGLLGSDPLASEGPERGGSAWNARPSRASRG